jgi:hypothetical protein
MTTVDLLKGSYLSFFRLDNRELNNNCRFVGEAFNLDAIVIEKHNGEKATYMLDLTTDKAILLGTNGKIELEELLEDTSIQDIKIINV